MSTPLSAWNRLASLATLGTRRAPLETQSLWPEASLAPLSEPASPERTLLRAASAQRLWDLAGSRAAPEANVTQPAPAPRFSRTPGSVAMAPQGPGAHTREALAAWGIEDVDGLVESGAAVQA